MRTTTLALAAVAAAPALALLTPLESLAARPLHALEKYVASKQIPRLDAAPAPLLKLSEAGAAGAAFDHGAWESLLRAHVADGLVNYDRLRKDRAAFDGYLASLANADVSALAPREQLAFFLNAYNALCVAHVLNAPPDLASILDLSTKETAIWDAPAGTLGGEVVSLNDVEHQKLRLVWAEPELHACIVCASTSCPDLASFAFSSEKLEAQMASRAEAWLSDQTKGCALERGGAVARLSRILLWFEDDFVEAGGALAFAAARADAATKASLGARPAVRYFAYDWSLNKA